MKTSLREEEPTFPKINFIGNKERLASWICDVFPKDATSVLDVFAGGGSVSYEAKKRGLTVYSNDILEINYILAKALIENSSVTLSTEDVDQIFKGTPLKGFMYRHYAGVRFFPEECMELDRYRKNIELLDPYKRSLALALMRRAMVRKMPYSRFNIKWDKVQQLRDEEYSYEKYARRRAYHNESFKSHFLSNVEDYNRAVFDNGKKNKAYNKDVFALLGKRSADIVYLDPPYTGTMNDYFGFYGVLDEYIDTKKKEPFENNFMHREDSRELFERLFSKLSSYKYWILSYNNQSLPSKEVLTELLSKYAKSVRVIERKHDYKITGKSKKRNNTEYLFFVENT